MSAATALSHLLDATAWTGIASIGRRKIRVCPKCESGRIAAIPLGTCPEPHFRPVVALPPTWCNKCDGCDAWLIVQGITLLERVHVAAQIRTRRLLRLEYVVTHPLILQVHDPAVS